MLFLLTACQLFLSCGNTANTRTKHLVFDSLQVNETAHLFADTAKPACNIVLNLCYVASAADDSLKECLNHYFLSLSLGSLFDTLPPQQAADEYTQSYIRNYRNDLEPMYKRDEEEATLSAWYSYYKMIRSSIYRCSENILTYANRYEEYTGGAHGMYMTTYLNLDLRTLTPIRLDDLFCDDYTEALTELLWKQLMADKGVSNREELYDLGYVSTGELTPTENFRLEEDGITFYYNVYDIAPYAMGPVSITLPMDEVQHLMGNPAAWGK